MTASHPCHAAKPAEGDADDRTDRLEQLLAGGAEQFGLAHEVIDFKATGNISPKIRSRESARAVLWNASSKPESEQGVVF